MAFSTCKTFTKLSILTTLSLLCLTKGVAFAQDINGGTSWNGWTSKGLSNTLGVYGSGLTTDIYETYTTVFRFNNHSVSGGAVGGGPTGGVTGFGTGSNSTGAFAFDNTIFGIGVRRVSGASLTNFTPTVRFDRDADSYQSASSVGGVDGRTSFTSWSETGDFTVQFNGASSWRGNVLTMQVGNGTSNGGPNNQQQLPGGGSVGYDFAFRAFAQADSYQMFFDMGAMQTLYGVSNPFGVNANFTGIGTVSDPVRISLNGLGTNNVAFGAPTTTPSLVSSAAPEPTSVTMGLIGLGILGLRLRRRK